MKHIIQTLALCASMLWLATACQPEVPVGEPLPTYKLEYSVDNSTHTETLVGDPALDSLLRRLVVATGNGSRVHVKMLEFDGQAPATKETRTFVSDSEEEAVAWSRNMLKQGYDVEIVQKDGHYHCTALLLSNGVLTSLVGTKWYCHVDEFRQNVPTMGDIHWVCDYWYSFDDENTGTKSGDAKATITPDDGAVTEQEELLTGNFDYSFDPSTGHIFVNNYVVDNHNYPPANYELVYDSETNTLRYVSGNMLDSVYTRVE